MDAEDRRVYYARYLQARQFCLTNFVKATTADTMSVKLEL